MDTGGRTPITTPYFEAGLCPVNVHWHLGAEHLSVGEYDEAGTGPTPAARRLGDGSVRLGHQCHHYDASDPKFTTPYQKIGVQGQVYTIVNDENYYYPDLMRGMIVDG